MERHNHTKRIYENTYGHKQRLRIYKKVIADHIVIMKFLVNRKFVSLEGKNSHTHVIRPSKLKKLYMVQLMSVLAT